MFLPICMEDMKERGWEHPDFVMVTGDAYVDHPSFGTAIISRVLESHGYKVAILAQPDWRTADDFKRFGAPRLGFMINSGNVDSMVNHYSVFKHRRKNDAYSPGGVSGRRPDRAVIVYSNRAREAYPGIPVIIGGLEASLRRLGHYDYWDDKVRRSVLLDSKADILIYGMGERAAVEIADALDAGIDIKDLDWIRGTCVRKKDTELFEDDIILPDFDDIVRSKKAYCRSFAMQYRSNDAVTGRRVLEKYREGIVVQNPPQPPLEREELDEVYGLDYMRDYHPVYEKEGGVPAIREVKFSITANRGCFGGCAFCAITYHQGREVRSRSTESIVEEARKLTKLKDFKGYIHDVGGPTANFRKPSCAKQKKHGMCERKDCLFPKPCRELEADHSEYMEVLDAVRNVDGVKKVFIRSGIRYDYLLADKSNEFLKQLCRYHVSGILKVAPEHIADGVLKCMHKPGMEVFDEFKKEYEEMNEKLGLKQYMVPYFISSHPGSRLEDAVELALYMKKTGFIPDQVQDFYPTPGTLSTCMYYTGMDPFTLKPVYVAKTEKEKKMQRALLHFHKKENREMVKKALKEAGRQELERVLIPEKHRGRK
ncbi:MAG: YgiQ family radical SAM protein [Anaerovoracaceae bacterium]|uniref:YgiQ family radical SAM protein n=1 Tax=Candidatus Allocopromorpha excrementavium TaxID=2840741 RepID=A0A9D1HD08_9FIRM|nr:YgiQ family radical SAM protein [Candidatus Copromorpha excrementavium]